MSVPKNDKWRKTHERALTLVVKPGRTTFENEDTGKIGEVVTELFFSQAGLKSDRLAESLAESGHESTLIKVWSMTLGMITLPDPVSGESIKDLILREFVKLEESRVPSYVLVNTNDIFPNSNGGTDFHSSYLAYCLSIEQKDEIGKVINPEAVGDDIHMSNEAILNYLRQNKLKVVDKE